MIKVSLLKIYPSFQSFRTFQVLAPFSNFRILIEYFFTVFLFVGFHIVDEPMTWLTWLEGERLPILKELRTFSSDQLSFHSTSHWFDIKKALKRKCSLGLVWIMGSTQTVDLIVRLVKIMHSIKLHNKKHHQQKTLLGKKNLGGLSPPSPGGTVPDSFKN